MCSLRSSATTVLENSPVGDSRANGRVERDVQEIEKQARILKIATEDVLGKFSVRHPAFAWLVIHAADVLTKFHPGADGATAYEKLRGRPYSGMMFEFAQVVLYKTSMKPQGGDMQPRWEKGRWLGKRFATEEHVIGTTSGSVLRAAAVNAHSETIWDSHFCRRLKGCFCWIPAVQLRQAKWWYRNMFLIFPVLLYLKAQRQKRKIFLNHEQLYFDENILIALDGQLAV